MKLYDFLDKSPSIGKLAIVEGTERVLAEIALEKLVERILPPEVRDLNYERFAAADLNDVSRVREAAQSMPFLAGARVTAVVDTQTLKAQMRRDLWAVAESVPDGNTFILVDLLSPRSVRPQSFGALAGRAALRIDTTANDDTRARFVRETLDRLGATAEPRALDELVGSGADLAALRNDLEKLALGGRRITLKDLESESVSIADPKAYLFAGAVVEGKVAEALAIAGELFANDPRSAGIPLLSALATECGLLWEMSRPGGSLPARAKWRERFLRPLASRVGERRARAAYERAVRGFEAIVTGRSDDPKVLVEMLAVELSGMSATRRR